LLEVKGSALGTDVEHLGDRLAIYVDRVELRDRLDRVRQSINGDDIAGVSVQKRLTGAVLTIDSARGPGIVAKGLRADQAEEARRLILTKTRPSRLMGEKVPSPPPTPPSQARAAFDAAELLGKLGDLRAAGILTDDEYEQKRELIRQLARGENLAPSRT
jgi:hypothetical protein